MSCASCHCRYYYYHNSTSHHQQHSLMIAAQRTGALLKQLHRLFSSVDIKMVSPAEKSIRYQVAVGLQSALLSYGLSHKGSCRGPVKPLQSVITTPVLRLTSCLPGARVYHKRAGFPQSRSWTSRSLL